MFGEKMIANLEWKENAIKQVISWRQDFEELEEAYKDKLLIPKNIKDEVELLFKQLPTIDVEEEHMISLFKVKMQLINGKLKQFLSDIGATLMGKNKHKFRHNGNFNKGYTAPKQFNHQEQKKESVPAVESSPSFNVPSFRAGYTPSSMYQKIKDTKCNFSKFEPEVVLTKLAYDKITAWCRLLSEEITALGVVEQEGTDFIVKDFFLFHQVVTGGTCEARDAIAICDLMEEVEKHGYDSSMLKCWWHSHNSMGTSPSQRDLKTAEEFGGRSYLISLINNHRGEFNCRLTIYAPFLIEITDVPLYVMEPAITNEFIEERKAEIKEFVRTRSYASTPTYIPRGGGFHSNYHQPTLLPEIQSDMHVNRQLLDNGLIEQGDENFVADDILKDRIIKGLPLYDACMFENSIRYVWDDNKKRYKMYDAQNNELTSDDLKELGAYDYNQEIEEWIVEIESDKLVKNFEKSEGA